MKWGWEEQDDAQVDEGRGQICATTLEAFEARLRHVFNLSLGPS
ncbi:hypothetical protein E2C01_062945 [Portunus trituberculatus]|uniref:Uncharacterized protein n=1 Tax=Portunus trituberculatus TaxID=210409 RepID=A0A5B7HIY5_PORTR|nr:hypothetical protein [Portunus trituberculatus]